MTEGLLKSKQILTAGFVKAGQKYALPLHQESAITSLTTMNSFQ
jgi:hypothetical protein